MRSPCREVKTAREVHFSPGPAQLLSVNVMNLYLLLKRSTFFVSYSWGFQFITVFTGIFWVFVLSIQFYFLILSFVNPVFLILYNFVTSYMLLYLNNDEDRLPTVNRETSLCRHCTLFIQSAFCYILSPVYLLYVQLICNLNDMYYLCLK